MLVLKAFTALVYDSALNKQMTFLVGAREWVEGLALTQEALGETRRLVSLSLREESVVVPGEMASGSADAEDS